MTACNGAAGAQDRCVSTGTTAVPSLVWHSRFTYCSWLKGGPGGWHKQT